MEIEELYENIAIWIELVGVGIDILGVIIIVWGIIWSMGIYLRRQRTHPDIDHYRSFKVRIGRYLLIGLEVLVAADIIKTVALEPDFENLGVLALLVVIRTFLSWTLVLEIEGRWPWQPEPPTAEVDLSK